MSRPSEFFRCEVCGNFVRRIDAGNGTMMCCGLPMTRLVPNTTDGAVEKHLPVVTGTELALKISIGSTPHPMEEKHHIDFVYVEGKSTGLFCRLQVGSEPKVTLPLSEAPEIVTSSADEPLADGLVAKVSPGDGLMLTSQPDGPLVVYAYCNLHGLWAVTIEEVVRE